MKRNHRFSLESSTNLWRYIWIGYQMRSVIIDVCAVSATVVLLLLEATATGDRRCVGRCDRRGRRAAIRCRLWWVLCGLLDLLEFFDEFRQFGLGRKAQTIDSICAYITPLAKFLWCLCEWHVRCYRWIDDGLAAFDAYNSIQISRWIVEEAHRHRLRTGCYPCSLCFRIDVENVCVTGEYWLLTILVTEKKKSENGKWTCDWSKMKIFIKMKKKKID